MWAQLLAASHDPGVYALGAGGVGGGGYIIHLLQSIRKDLVRLGDRMTAAEIAIGKLEIRSCTMSANITELQRVWPRQPPDRP